MIVSSQHFDRLVVAPAVDTAFHVQVDLEDLDAFDCHGVVIHPPSR